MIAINPRDISDCAACKPECPVDAIKYGTTFDDDYWFPLNRRPAEHGP